MKKIIMLAASLMIFTAGCWSSYEEISNEDLECPYRFMEVANTCQPVYMYISADYDDQATQSLNDYTTRNFQCYETQNISCQEEENKEIVAYICSIDLNYSKGNIISITDCPICCYIDLHCQDNNPEDCYRCDTHC